MPMSRDLIVVVVVVVGVGADIFQRVCEVELKNDVFGVIICRSATLFISNRNLSTAAAA
jgi:hypothetical protein